MKSIFYQLIIRTRRALWAIIVAYMLGIHNFYKGEDKTPDDLVITIEVAPDHNHYKRKAALITMILPRQKRKYVTTDIRLKT